jgi:hypothetical protein
MKELQQIMMKNCLLGLECLFWHSFHSTSYYAEIVTKKEKSFC